MIMKVSPLSREPVQKQEEECKQEKADRKAVEISLSFLLEKKKSRFNLTGYDCSCGLPPLLWDTKKAG